MSIDFSQKIAININEGVLLASVQIELSDDVMLQMQEDILSQVYNKQLKKVLIDVSGVEIIDSFVLTMFADIVKMLKLLGAKTLFTGIKPEVAASLVDFGNISDEMDIVLNTDIGFKVLNVST